MRLSHAVYVLTTRLENIDFICSIASISLVDTSLSLDEIRNFNMQLSDTCNVRLIELLIGNDICTSLYTGKMVNINRK